MDRQAAGGRPVSPPLDVDAIRKRAKSMFYEAGNEMPAVSIAQQDRRALLARLDEAEEMVRALAELREGADNIGAYELGDVAERALARWRGKQAP
jgi:hypothetical protein